MIQAVSTSKVGNSKGVFSNYQGNGNYMSGNINRSAYTFSKYNNISFKGNLASEAIGITKKIAKELPAVKKSLIAAASDLIHIIGDGQGTIRVPLEEVSVSKDVVLDANNIIVPHVTNLAGEALKEGVSTAGHEAASEIVQGTAVAIKENAAQSAAEGAKEGAKEAGHGLFEGIKEAIHEALTNI